MKKIFALVLVSAAAVVYGNINSSTVQPVKNLDPAQHKSSSFNSIASQKLKINDVCDGTNVKSNCTIDGVEYSTYISHPATAEKNHIETTSVMKQEISDYCTLCSDGSYSPSCATGRGACSHHGGVAQLGAPRYRDVPVQTENVIIDEPSTASYVEKIKK